ncbi:MAG: hypothetical protein E2600_09985 [Chryseobacterium sp.]|nr:hypothetical protein [Chryseobacterium sp.]
MEKIVDSLTVVSQVVKEWLKIKMNEELFNDVDVDKNIIITTEKRLKAEIHQDASLLNTESSLYLRSLIAHLNTSPPPIDKMVTEIKSKSIHLDMLG